MAKAAAGVWRRTADSYKWIALSNTTLGVLMATINQTILIISLPAIFRGIDINPLTNTGQTSLLLWILMGFNVATTILLVSFGRISDTYGRVRLYNLGFLIFTFGSLLLFLTPFVNIAVLAIFVYDLAGTLDEGGGFAIGLFVLSVIFVSVLGYGPARYVGPEAR